MSDIQAQIKSKIAAFTSDLEALVRRAAMEAVGNALGSAPTRSHPAVSTARAAPVAGRADKRVRRSASAMTAAADRILTHIKAHPGQRSEEIRDALGIPKNVWQPAARNLLDQKRITAKGVKRATTYTAR